MTNEEYERIRAIWDKLPYGHPAKGLYDRRGEPLSQSSIGRAWERALIEGGVLPNPNGMGGSEEYEEIIAAQDLMGL